MPTKNAKKVIQETLQAQPWIAPDYSATATSIEAALRTAGLLAEPRQGCEEPSR